MATETTFIQFVEGSVPSTPATGKWRVYAKTDGFYIVDDAGAETGPFGTGGGGAGASDALKQTANFGLLSYVTGRYYGGWGGAQLTGGAFAAVDTLVHVPFYAIEGETFDRIGINVTTLQASGLARLGIYESAADGTPGALVLDAGTVDCSTTGAKEITISQALTADTWYWLAIVLNNGSIGATRYSADEHALNYGFPNLTDAGPAWRYEEAHTFGALPDPSTAVAAAQNLNMPRIMLRAT
jgi:hypothetical protein